MCRPPTEDRLGLEPALGHNGGSGKIDEREDDVAAEATDDIERMEFQLTLRRRGISDKAVLRAMDEVPREHFVGANEVPSSPMPIRRCRSRAARPSASLTSSPT